MKSYIRKNKYFIGFIIIMVVISLLSFCQYFHQEFSYVKKYRTIETNCFEKQNPEDEICNVFVNEEQIISFLDSYDPVKTFEEIDAISLTMSIIENTLFGFLQFFSPLLIIFSVVGSLHTEYSSGMFKNYLLRMNYKDYLKKKYKIVLKTAIVIPLILVFIFFVSCLITNFNFNVAEEVKNTHVYQEWRHSNFFLYQLTMCCIQFLMSIFYGNIGLFCFKSNRHKITAIIMGYLVFFAINTFIYIIFYAKFLNRVLGLKNLTELFSITGYWFFDTPNDCFWALLISLVLQIISTLLVYFYYSNKGKLVLSYEKQMA